MGGGVEGPLADSASVIIPVFELFRDVRVAVALSGGLLLVALLLLSWVICVRIIPLILRLDRLRRRLQRVAGRAEMVGAMPEVHRAALSIRALAPAWRRFADSLLPPQVAKAGGGEGCGVWRTTARSGQIVTLEALDLGGAGLRFYQSLPHYFVGMGLMLTFIGLVAALYFASQAVASNDVQVAQTALGALLKAATFKFLTSIAGLASSLILSLAFRLGAQAVHRALIQVTDALDQRLLLVTDVGLGIDRLALAQQQRDTLARLPVELEKRLGEALPLMLKHAVAPITEAITTAVAGVAESLGSLNQEALSRMVGDFQDNLSRGTGREMTALAEMMVEIRNSLRLLNTSLQQAGASFGGQINSAADRLEDLTASAGLSLKNDLLAAARELNTASRPVMQMTERLIQAAGELEGASRALVSAQSGFEGLAQQVGTVARTLESATADHQQRFAQIDRQLGDSFGVFVTGAEQYRAHIASFMQELDTHLERVLGAIANGVDELAHVVDELGRTTRPRVLA